MLILEELLGLLNLRKCFPERVPPDVDTAVRSGVERMFAWSRVMGDGNKAFPLFNDAAHGVAPEFSALEAYARRLGLKPGEAIMRQVSRLLPDSGFARLEHGSMVLFADVGGPGPSYQPGHCHAGTLGFECWWNGNPVLVDAGTGTYESKPERWTQRSTVAHNTLAVNGRDTSEVWASFRVGRRANVHGVRLSVAEEGAAELVAKQDGYRKMRLAGLHERSWRLTHGVLRVKDSLRLRRKSEIAIRFQLAPGGVVSRAGNFEWELCFPFGKIGMTVSPEFVWEADRYLCSREFGLFEESELLVGRATRSGLVECQVCLNWVG